MSRDSFYQKKLLNFAMQVQLKQGQKSVFIIDGVMINIVQVPDKYLVDDEINSVFQKNYGSFLRTNEGSYMKCSLSKKEVRDGIEEDLSMILQEGDIALSLYKDGIVFHDVPDKSIPKFEALVNELRGKKIVIEPKYIEPQELVDLKYLESISSDVIFDERPKMSPASASAAAGNLSRDGSGSVSRS